MDTEYYLLTENGDSGTYWDSLPTTDPGDGTNYKERYGTAGSYRVFGSMYDLRDYLYANRDSTKEIYVEIQGAWTDTSAWYLVGTGGAWRFDGYFSMTFATRIMGKRESSSFHHGIPGSGWRWISNSNYFDGFSSYGSRITIDGVEAGDTYGYVYTYCFQMSGSLCTVKNCIATASGAAVGMGNGFADNGMANNFFNNIAINRAYGFRGRNYKGDASIMAHNLAVSCDTGFICDGTTNHTEFVNNLAFDNTTNWGAAGTGTSTHNAGETGDTIWDTSGTTAITGVTTSDFTDYAGGDYSIANSTSILVNSGTDYFDLLTDVDITDAVRPNYESATFPDNLVDVGPFEYDHGEGLAPSTVTIRIKVEDISGDPIDNVRVRLLKTSDDSVVLEGLTNASGIIEDTSFTYTSDVPVYGWTRKSSSSPFYKQGVISGTITENGLNTTIIMIVDE